MTTRTKKQNEINKNANTASTAESSFNEKTNETNQIRKPEDDWMLNIQPYISRVTFKMGATIPTGDYANLTPSIEITYDVPEGAASPTYTTVLDELRQSIVDAVYPMIINQTSKIHLTIKMMQSSDNEQLTIRTAFSASPLFLWLSTIDPVSAAMIVEQRLEAYEKAYEKALAQANSDVKS